MNKFSLIIPCYNEYKNIEGLIKQIKKLGKSIKFETIIVENGSSDQTRSELIKIKKKRVISNLKIILINKNKGFGYAIKKAIAKSSTNLICYTHADLQTDIQDVFKAFKIYKKNNNKDVFIKGYRTKRSYFDVFFTYGMAILSSLIFRTKLIDIHAQPNFFDKKMITNLNYIPNNFGIDTYLLLLSKKRSYKLIRFNVFFSKRKYGIGNNDGLCKKVMHTFYVIQSLLSIFFYGKL